MPVMPCTDEGKPGFKWGERGKCYTYTPGNIASKTRARLKVEMQGRAIKAQEGSKL
jgi:hypothetical protein